MGYHTDFEGTVSLNKALEPELYDFLVKFNETRRMKRDVQVLNEMGFTGDYGIEGEFFVDGFGFMGQDWDKSVIDGNKPPRTQPGLWCNWRPTNDMKGIEWDEGEKFYDSPEWMAYLINNFLAPNGYIANGVIFAQGEDPDDTWELHVVDNEVTVYYL